jgi:hypothetical protein
MLIFQQLISLTEKNNRNKLKINGTKNDRKALLILAKRKS